MSTESKSSTTHPMNNRPFIAFDAEGHVERYGNVVGMVGSEFALVHVADTLKLVPIRDMLAWTFYDDNAAASAALAVAR